MDQLLHEAYRARRNGNTGAAQEAFSQAVKLTEASSARISPGFGDIQGRIAPARGGLATLRPQSAAWENASCHDHAQEGLALTQIKPQLIQTIVERALVSGWSPDRSGDFSLEIVENTGQERRPALLVLPGLGNDIEGYENRMIPIRIS